MADSETNRNLPSNQDVSSISGTVAIGDGRTAQPTHQQSPEPSAGTAAHQPNNDGSASPQFVQTFSLALDIATMAESVLESASQASYRSFVADNLARQTLENAQAVTGIAHDVCRTARAAVELAVKTCRSDGVTVEDAYELYCKVKKPPIGYEQFQQVMHSKRASSSGRASKSINLQPGPSRPTEPTQDYYNRHGLSRVDSPSKKRWPAIPKDRDGPSPPVSRRSPSPRNRSPDVFGERYPSPVEQCMEDFALHCSSCSSLPSLPEDDEIDRDFPEDGVKVHGL